MTPGDGDSLDWAGLVRRHVALRDNQLLQQAISLAPSSVRNFLKAYVEFDVEILNDTLAHVVADSGGSESVAGRTIRLLYDDRFCWFVDNYTQFEATRQLEQLNKGLRACESALRVSQQLDDAPCVAHYAEMLARGLDLAGSKEPARRVYTYALDLYRKLAQDEPDIFRSFLAGTLTNFGLSLGDLRLLDEARHAHAESLEIYRSLSQDQPNVFLPHLAAASNNLGTALSDLRLHEDSRNAFVEALTTYRTLASTEPGIYLPHVAGTLNNLGNTHRDLRNLDEARTAFVEALSIRKSLAQDQPDSFLPSVAVTWNSLGNVLSDLGILEGARSAFKEALAIRRAFAENQPAVYLPAMAMTLNNLGAASKGLRSLEEARRHCTEALAIYRSLAQDQPSVYMPEVARTLNNLGNILGDLRLLEEARGAHAEALAIRRSLAQDRPGIYEPALAMSLNNLGNILRDLRHFEDARQAFVEALSIRLPLVQEQPQVHRPAVAMTLNNLGNVLLDLRLLEEARYAYTEALSNFRMLVQDQTTAFLPNVATALSNLGIVLRELRLNEDAREVLVEALSINRLLAKDSPGVYLPDVAVTLTNLGTVLSNSLLVNEARAAYVEACEILAESDAINAAKSWALLARLEMEHGSREAAVQHSQTSVRSMERGLAMLSDATHHDKFKRDIDDVYGRLILAFAGSADDACWSLLPALLEAQRRVEVLSENAFSTVGAGDGTILASLLLSAQAGSGRLANQLASLQAAFLWIQREADGEDRTSAAFVLFRPGSPLKAWAGPVGPLWRMTEKIHPDRVQRQLGVNAWAALPDWLQQALLDPGIRTLFVSSCGNSGGVPLELLVANGEWIGLQKLFVRAHGIMELDETIHRSNEGKTSVVVANPPHNETVNLEDAEAAALDVHGMVNTGPCWIGPRARRAEVLKSLLDPDLGLFVYCGHGHWGQLLLAADERLLWTDLPKGLWPTHPFVHLDCCNSGLAWSQGGGRMAGMPFAALEAGASAVLASSVPLYDKPAADFTRALYRRLLENGLNLGEALMAARSEIHQQYPNAPHHWGSSVLWGNPSVRLKHE
jgi:tetratricopeptide (TPR) repeat protein